MGCVRYGVDAGDGASGMRAGIRANLIRLQVKQTNPLPAPGPPARNLAGSGLGRGSAAIGDTCSRRSKNEKEKKAKHQKKRNVTLCRREVVKVEHLAASPLLHSTHLDVPERLGLTLEIMGMPRARSVEMI
jgi:hypothetical protein